MTNYSSRLSPSESSRIAQKVYNIRFSDNIYSAFGQAPDLRENRFDFENPLATLSCFGEKYGWVVRSKSNVASEVLIAFRGTHTKLEWANNFNILPAPGPTGTPVHMGFKTIFEPLWGQISFALKGVNFQRALCVGHSLGAALATLAAAKCGQRGKQVELYTFGGPNVGTLPFAAELVMYVGTSNIFTVRAFQDPITYIPIFPYAPNGPAFLISNGSNFLDSSAHDVGFYQSSVDGESWSGLLAQSLAHATYALKMMLKIVLDAPPWVIDLIADAIRELIRLSKKHIGMAAAAASGSIFDVLAWLGKKHNLIENVLPVWLAEAIRTVLGALGIQTSPATKITKELVDYVLSRLLGMLSSKTTQAVQALS